MDNEYGFIESKKGFKMLVSNGFTYRMSKLIKNTVYWLCAHKGCNARAILSQTGEFKLSKCTRHNHPRNYEDAVVRYNLVALKKLTLQSNDSPEELMRAVGIEEDPDNRYLHYIKMWRCKAKRKSKLQLLKALQLHDYSEELTTVVGTDYKFVKTDRASNLMVCHNGFIYRKHKTKNGYSYWRCRERNCSATAKMSEGGCFTVTNKAHNHKSCSEDVEEVFKNKITLKKLALETYESPENLLSILDLKDGPDKKYIEAIKTWRASARRKVKKEEKLMKISNSSEYVPIVGDDYQFVKTDRATHLFIYFRGFVYRKYKEIGRNSYWRCRTKTCKGGGKLDASGFFTVTNNSHNHETLQVEQEDDDQNLPLETENALTDSTQALSEETMEYINQEKQESLVEEYTEEVEIEECEDESVIDNLGNYVVDCSSEAELDCMD